MKTSNNKLKFAFDELKISSTCELRSDEITNILYSTDASIYKIEPLGVIYPKTEEDLLSAIKILSAYEIPIIPRGSGSGLAGQAIGHGVIIDCSKYLTQIIDIDYNAKEATVLPGVTIFDLNKACLRYDLMFAPDPSSEGRATIGGSLANNASGGHSIMYGMTVDHIISMDVIFADGTEATLREVHIDEAEEISKGDSIEAALYREALRIKFKEEDIIKEFWPKTWRSASGYNIHYLIPWAVSKPPRWFDEDVPYPPIGSDYINLSHLIAGSEGTLAIIKRATLRLVPIFQNTVLAVLSFKNIEEACDAVVPLMETNSLAGIELVPGSLIERAKKVPSFASKLSFVSGKPGALLVIELEGYYKSKLIDIAERIRSDIYIASSEEQKDNIRKVRKGGLGLLMSMPGDAKPIAFIEDIAVPLNELSNFVRGLERIFEEYETSGEFYAHASAGCLHVRPIVDLKSNYGSELIREIAKDAVELANEVDGSLSGEHGDGISRSEWLEFIFGYQICEIFCRIKEAVDPKSLLNPGKIVDAYRMNENLRYGSKYKSKGWEPVLDFSSQSNLEGAIEMCNGQGDCLEKKNVMCPSYQVLKDEMHSTRGRANILRAMISNELPFDVAEAAAHEALDLCLECKGCKSECPSSVDIAKLKYEFLHEYYKKHRRKIRDYFFGYIGLIARFGKPFAGPMNLILGNSIIKFINEKFFGISAKRKMLTFSKLSVTKVEKSTNIDSRNVFETVLFLSDPFHKYYYSNVEKAAFELLKLAGCKVKLLGVVGVGRTFISKGFLKKAKKQADKVIKAIKKVDPKGEYPVIGLEPSEILTLRDEFPDFFPEDEYVEMLADRAFMIDEFLIRERNNTRRVDYLRKELGAGLESRNVYLHGHCYQKATAPHKDGFPVGEKATVEFLKSFGFDVRVIDSGCCGMAGSFGYEKEHYDLSMQIGELKLFPAVRGAKKDDLIVAAGVSCRSQIEDGASRKGMHPVEIILNL